MSDVAALVHEETAAEEERKTSYLELFFDLVFVFAFTQVTTLILEDTSLQGFARAALVLAMVWWAWSAYAWMTNAIDVENTVTRLIVFAAMTAGFFMALAVPHAFQDEAAWFAVAYFVVRVLNSALYAWGVRGDPEVLRAVARLSPWFVVAALVALAGGFVDADYRAWVWLASLVIDVVGTLTVASMEWHVSPSHFAERFALIVIIALGESIVAIGIATSDAHPRCDVRRVRDRRLRRRRGALVGVLRLHGDRCRARSSSRRARRAARSPGTCSRSSTTRSCSGSSSTRSRRRRRSSIRSIHCPRPAAGHSGWGSRCSSSGFALMRFRVVRRVAWERLGAAALALALAVALDGPDAIVTFGVVIAVVLASVTVESARLHDLRASLRGG